MPAAIVVIIGILAGGAGAFISLEAYYVGLLMLAAAGGWLMIRQASQQRWFALGVILLGMGACAAGFLSQALTNHDPAVTYDPSSITTFFLSVGLGLCGVATLVVAIFLRRTTD